jgi:transmembrane sensor
MNDMDSNRFNQLLDRYLANEASAEEQRELMDSIQAGADDELIKNRIDAMLTADTGQQDMSMERAQLLLERIFSTEKQPAKVVPLNPVRTWRWVAAAAVVAIAATAGWWQYNKEVPVEKIGPIAQQEEKQPAVFSGKQFIHLPDGSTVLLNEGSELSYAASFGEQAREVVLKGEGYFDVQHDPARPFKVLTGKVTTTVLGTAFNIKAYPGQKEIKVTVTRGKVKVGDARRTYGQIAPDQQITVNTLTYHFTQSNTKAAVATEWKSNYLILDDVSMEAAAAIIEEKYHAKIIFGNEELKACRFTATFLNGEDLEQVLAVVSGVVQASYTRLPDGAIRMEGNGCK